MPRCARSDSMSAISKSVVLRFMFTSGRLACRVVRHRRRAQPAGHLEPAALVRALRRRARAQASTLAAIRLQAFARAARCRVRGIANRSAETRLPTQTGAAHGARRMAHSLPPLLV